MPVTEAVPVEAQPEFTQPQCYQGQEVLWYPRGDRAETSPHRAVVSRVWADGTVRLNLIGGGIATTHTQKVRHMDDPYFLTHPFARTNDGAWDHTEYVKLVTKGLAEIERTKAILEDVANQVASLEAIVEGLSKKK